MTRPGSKVVDVRLGVRMCSTTAGSHGLSACSRRMAAARSGPKPVRYWRVRIRASHAAMMRASSRMWSARSASAGPCCPWRSGRGQFRGGVGCGERLVEQALPRARMCLGDGGPGPEAASGRGEGHSSSRRDELIDACLGELHVDHSTPAWARSGSARSRKRASPDAPAALTVPHLGRCRHSHRHERIGTWSIALGASAEPVEVVEPPPWWALAARSSRPRCSIRSSVESESIAGTHCTASDRRARRLRTGPPVPPQKSEDCAALVRRDRSLWITRTAGRGGCAPPARAFPASIQYLTGSRILGYMGPWQTASISSCAITGCR